MKCIIWVTIKYELVIIEILYPKIITTTELKFTFMNHTWKKASDIYISVDSL